MFRQKTAIDCGPTCLKMLAEYYGISYNPQSISHIDGFCKHGVSLLGIAKEASKIGLKTIGLHLTFDQLVKLKSPAILYLERGHFVVFLPKRKIDKLLVRIADPARGIMLYSKGDFIKKWQEETTEFGKLIGTVLLVAPA